MNPLFRFGSAIRAACAGAMLLCLQGAAASEGAAVNAVWKVQEIYFSYFGLTTYYSCDGLRDKMRVILSQLGVRDDMVVTEGGCETFSGPSVMPSVRMLIAHPTEATETAIAAQTQSAERAAWLARMQRGTKKQFSDEPFMAERRQVTLSSKDRLGGRSDAGDCELLEQVARYLIPKLGGKVVQDRLGCVPHQGTIRNPSVAVEVLLPVKAEQGKAIS